MKLHSSSATPFGRKVEVVAIEKGLTDRIEIIATSTSPTAPHEALARVNPLIKIPTLIQDDGRALYDSLVICDYFDTLRSPPRVIPESGQKRWDVLTVHALASGICDAAVSSRYEQALRPEAMRWPEWVKSQMKKIESGLDWLEGNVGMLGDAGTAHVDLAQVAVGCALDYLDFRFAAINWRKARPRLSAWSAEFAKRASMQRTMPKA
jgi:glutathione S-transferase